MSDEPKRSSAGEWPADAQNLHAPDDHAGPANIPEEVLEAGHEPDSFDYKNILVIPLAVLGFFVVSFGVTIPLFWYLITSGEPDPKANPFALETNNAPLNERISRINDPKGDVRQPRLEWIREMEANDQALNFTSQPVKDKNSLEFHPEDLRPTAAYAKGLGLDSYKDDKNQKAIMIPIQVAMEIAAAKGNQVLPALEGEKAVNPNPSPRRPKLSNGGGQPLPSAEDK